MGTVTFVGLLVATLVQSLTGETEVHRPPTPVDLEQIRQQKSAFTHDLEQNGELGSLLVQDSELSAVNSLDQKTASDSLTADNWSQNLTLDTAAAHRLAGGRARNSSDDHEQASELGTVSVDALGQGLFVLSVRLASGSLRVPLLPSPPLGRPGGGVRHFHATPPSLGGVSQLAGGAVLGDVFTPDEHVSVAPEAACVGATAPCHAVRRGPLPAALPCQRAAPAAPRAFLRRYHGHDRRYHSQYRQFRGRRRHGYGGGALTRQAGPSPAGAKSLELRVAVFVEQRAVQLYETVLARLGGRNRLRVLLDAYLNQLAAAYRHPSLGLTVALTFPVVQVWRAPRLAAGPGSALDRFCRLHQPLQKGAGYTWDVGLLLYGGDLDKNALGVAQLGTVCGEAKGRQRTGCAAVEFGSRRAKRRDGLPSAGLGTAALVAAHELGHTLGLRHDGDGNSCADGGFLMASGSDSRRPALEWSACSRQAALRLWPGCLRSAAGPTRAPGHHLLSLDGQCQLQLADPQAAAAHDANPCRKLMCEQETVRAVRDALMDDHNLEPFSDVLSPGPALEGSRCGAGLACRAGRCAPCAGAGCATVVRGRWSAWQPLGCRSPCYEGSVGMEVLTRRCLGPDPSVPADCGGGPRVRHRLCAVRCPTQRSWSDDGQELCRAADGSGSQPVQEKYDAANPAAACAVRCRKTDAAGRRLYWWPTNAYFSRNLNGDGPFYPDGMLCHTSGGTKYYCVGHRCLPESQISKA